MRHFYIRLVLGIVFLICAGITAVQANFQFLILYLAMGGCFLYSAYRIWKNNKGGRE